MDMSALCKYNGRLVLAMFSPTKNTGGGFCPLCLGTEFEQDSGWLECSSCRDFAILESHHERILQCK